MYLLPPFQSARSLIDHTIGSENLLLMDAPLVMHPGLTDWAAVEQALEDQEGRERVEIAATAMTARKPRTVYLPDGIPRYVVAGNASHQPPSPDILPMSPHGSDNTRRFLSSYAWNWRFNRNTIFGSIEHISSFLQVTGTLARTTWHQ